MQYPMTHNRPTLLMFSDCFPIPDGSPRRARAWDLLRCASTTHRVCLVAEMDGPINLQQWRQVANLTERVFIESRSARWRLQRKPPLELQGLISQQRFEVLLANSPKAWPMFGHIEASVRVCDLTFAPRCWDSSSRGSSPTHSVISWRQRIRDLIHARERAILSMCDRLIVDDLSRISPTGSLSANAVAVVSPDNPFEAWQELFRTTVPPIDESTLTVLPIQPVTLKKAA
ncbi:MAG: hypothetical protein Kow00105_06960 [Phycisphaeraceae bacterium]